MTNTASKWYEGAHNPMNSLNLPRATTDQHDCITMQEKSDSRVNVELKKKLTLLENYDPLD